MKFEILKEEDNRLLNRKQFLVKVTDVSVTPKRQDVWKAFSVKQGLDENKLVVDKIENQTGLRDLTVYFKYYDDEASLKRIELKSNLKNWQKLTGKEEKPKEEKPKEEKEEEKPEIKKVVKKEDAPEAK
ncbi:MAG: hypothetical protein COT14_00645 [Candidatus Diapherotrites archaeon CG08_land_8_20_14_0_20_30_16]|nr:MAG: hypothetical protein COT14_00645 [Candidatus Diapherotrites archaeon CG08_land_8_20_14_0_20_30_16]